MEQKYTISNYGSKHYGKFLQWCIIVVSELMACIFFGLVKKWFYDDEELVFSFYSSDGESGPKSPRKVNITHNTLSINKKVPVISNHKAEKFPSFTLEPDQAS